MKKYLALILAIVMIVAVFSQTAMAVTYAPHSWSSWPTQSTSNYKKWPTIVVKRYINEAYGTSFSYTSGTYTISVKARALMLQNALNNTGNYTLTEDGIVGSNTWYAMQHELCLSAHNNARDAYKVYHIDSSNYFLEDTVGVATSYCWDKVNNKWCLNTSSNASVATWELVSY